MESINMKGTLVIEKNGVVVQVVKNLVVNAGKNYIAATVQAGVGIPMSHMAVGTSLISPAVGDVALGVEVARVPITVLGGVVIGASTDYVGVFPAGVGTGSITEAGIFNAGVAGVMLNRAVFPVIAKGVGDEITITWTVALV